MNNSILLTLASGKPITQRDLADIAGLSTAELISSLKLLIDLGLSIELDNDEVRWVNPFSCLDSELIFNQLSKLAGLSVTVIDSVPSTNSFLTENETRHMAVLLAEHQSAGRGRHQRQWQSPVGKNIYLSFVWDLNLALLHPAISLCIGSALVSVLKKNGVSNAGMKWPNDLYAGTSKIGGILIESKTDSSSARLVIGVGINVHEQIFPEELSVTATTIEKEAGVGVDRNRVAADVISAIHDVMMKIELGQIDQLILGWREHDLSYNQQVDVHTHNDVSSGIARGIDTMGNLKVEINDELQLFHSAEISLRITE